MELPQLGHLHSVLGVPYGRGTVGLTLVETVVLKLVFWKIRLGGGGFLSEDCGPAQKAKRRRRPSSNNPLDYTTLP